MDYWRRRHVKAALLLGLAGALLAPIWSVRFLPIVDYPNHLASAFVLAHLKDPGFHFSGFYTADWNTYPYLAMDVILVGLERIVPIDLAGRLLVSLCVLSVPAAAWFFVRRANPGEERLALWSLLVANNLYFFLYGFLNLQLSLAVCLFLLGLWLWHLEHPRLGSWCVLLLVTTALYFTHLMGFAVAAVVMTVYGLSARRTRKEMLATGATYIPGALFYIHTLGVHGARGPLQWRALTDKIGSLVAVMVGCSPALDIITLLVLLGVLAWVQVHNPDFKWNPHWRRATGLLFLFYWLLPAAYGPATNVDKRLLPFIFVLSLSGARVGRRGRKLAWIVLVLFFVRAAAVERHFIASQPHLARLADAASAIPFGARVLPLVDWAGGAPQPERHFWAYGVIERGWLAPCLFHDPGVHPLALTPRAYDRCNQTFTSSQVPDWPRVESEFDYVWAYHVPQYTPVLSSLGKVVWAQEGLQVFQLGKGAAADKGMTPSPVR